MVSEETLVPQMGRIRDVRQGLDGYIYLVTDDREGKATPVFRMEPVERTSTGRTPAPMKRQPSRFRPDASAATSLNRSDTPFHASRTRRDAFDDVAAEILAVDRRDLSCMTMLLFGGPASGDELATALHTPRTAVRTTMERLQLAGYARFQPGGEARLELSERARKWIERIWAPLREDGGRLLDAYPTRQLALMAGLLRRVCERRTPEPGNCGRG